MDLPTTESKSKVKSPQFNRKSSKPIELQLLYELNDQHQQTPKVLEGLGKATKRGVRACPKCGVVNGTRGLKCKNWKCKFDFKQLINTVCTSTSSKAIARQENIDEAELCKNLRVLRLLSDDKLFSVERISKCSGDANDWGFVYLPLMEEVKTVIGMECRDAVAYQLMAFCYMRDCISSSSSFSLSKNRKRKPTDNTQQEQLCCDHVKASFLSKECVDYICHIDSNLFNTISLPQDIKLHLGKLICSEMGANPVVQKISEFIYVVRGNQDKNHPIGYTFVFFSNQSGEEESNMVEGEESSNHGLDFFIPTSPENDIAKASLTCWCGLKLDFDFFKSPCQPCLPLYACLLAVSSDLKQSKHCHSLLSAIDNYYKHVNLVQDSLLEQGDFPSGDKHDNKMVPILDEVVLDFLQEDSKNIKLDRGQKSTKKNSLKFGHIITDAHLPLVSTSDYYTSDSKRASVVFDDWMMFVMEAIEESMHYQSSGRPSLVFHIQQNFFNILLQRITTSAYKKKRLPDSIEFIEISPPLPPPHGTFNKYTWKLHNACHVQQIFSTSSQNRLSLSRCFIENEDGTYCKFEKPSDSAIRMSYGRPHIQPFHLKTQLKIGYDHDDLQNSSSTPFVIEWTPDLFKRSNVGELKLSFEFYHYRHGKRMMS